MPGDEWLISASGWTVVRRSAVDYAEYDAFNGETKIGLRSQAVVLLSGDDVSWERLSQWLTTGEGGSEQ